ncbi:MAG: hypothetical protein ACFBWO_07735 [Paracoccaceae bacterium]
MELRLACHNDDARTELGAMALASLDAGWRLLDRLRTDAVVPPANARAYGSATLHASDGTVVETIKMPRDAAMAFALAVSQVRRLRH